MDTLAKKVMDLEKQLNQQGADIEKSDERLIETGGVPNAVIFLGIWELVMLICFAAFTEYDAALFDGTKSAAQMLKYGHFQDIHVMVFVGFGFLMTFLRRYGISAVGFNMMIAVFAIQWHILVGGFMHKLFENNWTKITLNLDSFILADFAAAVVLITFGALLGKVSYQQLMVICFCEIIFFAANENMNTKWFKTSDIGGSVVLHTFGAYFGLAASWVLTPREKTKDHEDNSASYNSDIFAMIGTLFLFMFWPSFNSALAPANEQQRTVVNTLCSIVGSAATSFIVSYWARGGRFSMVDIQNATLAGGVAIGTTSNMALAPGGALAVGIVAGFLSVIGYNKISPWLEENCGIYDTCGIHNLHGMPGILAGIAGTVASASAEVSDYKSLANLQSAFPGRYDAAGLEVRTSSSQAGFQILFLAVTLFVSIVTGIATGYIASCVPAPKNIFEDTDSWEVGDEDHVPAWAAVMVHSDKSQ